MTVNDVLAVLAECRKRGLPVQMTLKYASVVATNPYDDEEDDDDDV